MSAKKPEPKTKTVAENRRARYNFAIEDDLEAGIVLEGSEVKSLRAGKANIAESYATVEGGELWLINSYIPPYAQARTFGHEERRRRKLLGEQARTGAALGLDRARGHDAGAAEALLQREGHRAKLQLGIARGKKTVDKRETEKKRDWQRQKARLLRQGS
jgi:SsrA-binding protein